MKSRRLHDPFLFCGEQGGISGLLEVAVSPDPSICREVPMLTLNCRGFNYLSFGVRAGWRCLLFLRKFVECRGYDAKGDRTLLGCSLPVFIQNGQAGIQQAYPPSAFRSHVIDEYDTSANL